MPSFEFVTVNVFTGTRFAGNPLAVFPDARGLTDAQMQALAAEFNLSETTFVLPPDNPQHHARVRIFTPKIELPFAGHPNVGTGFVLAHAHGEPARAPGVRGAGRAGARAHPARAGRRDHRRTDRRTARAVDRHCDPDRDRRRLRRPGAGRHSHHAAFAAGRLGRHAVCDRRGGDLEALSRASPDIAAFRAAAAQFGEISTRFALYLYVRRDGDATRLRARMFAPLGGVLEDPATGSAAAALAALLTSLAPGENADLHYEIEQGVEMGRPSQIIAGAQKTAEGPVLATVAGSCVNVMRGTVEV